MIGTLKDIYKRGGRSFERKTVVTKEINELTNTFDLVDMWRQKRPGTHLYYFEFGQCEMTFNIGMTCESNLQFSNDKTH